MSDVIIRAENLGKKYTIGHQAENGRYVVLRDVLVHNAKNLWNKTKDLVSGKPIIQGDTTEEVWALKDINFEIKRGEAVGIIGRNGAGKSTLLKILSRITEPSTGRVTIKGRVASLLEVGTGFHPELTGRENIYLNGTILGMTRAEIKKKFDEIVAFAEVEKYLDTPVKRYSSGMYVRLAFAVAAHLEPEILVVDEVLAVGDAEFQKKCLGKMGESTYVGRTVLFVSHNMAAIQSLCSNLFLLEDGYLISKGNVSSIIQQYTCKTQVGDGVYFLINHPRSQGNGAALIESFRIIGQNQKPTPSTEMGDELWFEIDVKSTISLDHGEFIIGLYNSLMQRVCQFSSADSNFFLPRNVRKSTIKCYVPNLNLTPGRYYLNLAILDVSRLEAYDHLSQAVAFDVLPKDIFGNGRLPDPMGGPCFFKAKWWSL